eukprot:1144158-Pelagomonas_calceolata.AAC.2
MPGKSQLNRRSDGVVIIYSAYHTQEDGVQGANTLFLGLQVLLKEPAYISARQSGQTVLQAQQAAAPTLPHRPEMLLMLAMYVHKAQASGEGLDLEEAGMRFCSHTKTSTDQLAAVPAV